MGMTLLSFIGTGRKRFEGERNIYATTKYDFGSSGVIETPMFFDALLLSGRYDVSDALIVGTESSSWGALLEGYLDKIPESEDLYLEIEDAAASKKVEEDVLARLEEALRKIWNIPVKCLAHSSDIDNDNAFDILSLYMERLLDLNSRELLIDITHGFRSMPILLTSALQLKETLLPDVKSIRLVYGEYGGDVSRLRELDAIWTGIELSRACDNFFQKFDASELSEMLTDFWPSGAKAISSLADSIQGNLLIWLDDVLKQLKNALQTPPDAPPVWFPPVEKRIRELHQKLAECGRKSRLCLTISELLAERRMYGQAIIALQLAFEAFALECGCEPESSFGDYEITKKATASFLKKLKIAGPDKEKVRNLANTRNSIAHGGSRSTHGGKPQAQNLPSQYKAYRGALERVERAIEEGCVWT